VGAALRNLIRYFHHQDQAAWVQLVIAGESVSLEYVMPPRSVGRDIIGDGAMAIAYCLMKELVSPAWAPIKVRLPRPRPADVRPYMTFFGPTVEFGAGVGALVFSPHWLEERIPPASIALRTLIEQHLEKRDQQLSTKFSDHLRRVIVAGMGSSEPSIETAAAALAMSRCMLNRRLRQENMTFRDVVDEVRLTLAQELLETTEASVSDIAHQLPYSETSVFIRAFRRWTGHSPGAWRLRCGTDDSGMLPPD
jgi:AraC-like DNA-binding protein